MEIADRGLINGSRVFRLKLFGLARSPAPPVSIMLSFALTPLVVNIRGKSDRELRPIDVPGRHHRPDDPGQLVGNGDGDDHGSTPFQQGFDPAASNPGACLRVANACSDDKQVPEIGIALFRNPAEPILPAGGILLRRSQAANSRPERNMVVSSTDAARAVAVTGPMPGIEDSNFAIGFTRWI